MKIENYANGNTKINSLEISSNEIIAILGNSNSGKTKVLNSILECANSLGVSTFSIQSNQEYFKNSKNPIAELRDMATSYGLNCMEINSIIDRGLTRLNCNPNNFNGLGLSSSDCLKLELINVLLLNPDILFIDNIGILNNIEGVVSLTEFIKLFGKTVLFTSVDKHIAENIATRCLFISDFNISEDTDVLRLLKYKKHTNNEVKNYLENTAF